MNTRDLQKSANELIKGNPLGGNFALGMALGWALLAIKRADSSKTRLAATAMVNSYKMVMKL